MKILYLSGALLCIAGSILFGIKLRFVHAVFHVFITAGTICFYVASLLLMQNYHGFEIIYKNPVFSLTSCSFIDIILGLVVLLQDVFYYSKCESI